MTIRITAIIVTKNEELHIDRCLKSLRPICSRIVVIDSQSTDRTEQLCRAHGAEFVVNPWKNYATQFNFGIDYATPASDWLIRIDADEYITADSVPLIARAIADAATDDDGIAIRRRIHFLGKRIAWGGIEPNWQLRIFRAGRGRCEVRWMDEHIIVDGNIRKSRIVMVDDNLNDIDWWTSKHMGYASREAIDAVLAYQDTSGNIIGQAGIKRFIKYNIYLKLPLAARAFLYFAMRYFLRLGFLDGYRGFLFHFLQGWWYRTIVDIKVGKIRSRARRDGISLRDAVEIETGIRL